MINKLKQYGPGLIVFGAAAAANAQGSGGSGSDPLTTALTTAATAAATNWDNTIVAVLTAVIVIPIGFKLYSVVKRAIAKA